MSGVNAPDAQELVTLNGLVPPFLDLIRFVLDGPDTAQLLPLWDAFADDVRRMASSGPQACIEDVKELAQSTGADALEEAIEKELYDRDRSMVQALALVLGLNPEVTTFTFSHLVDRVRGLKVSESRIPALQQQVEEYSKYPNQLADALGNDPEASPIWEKLLSDVENLSQDETMARSVIDCSDRTYCQDLAETLGIELGEFCWSDLLKGVAVHVGHSKDLADARLRISELESGGARPRVDVEAAAKVGPKADEKQSHLTDAQKVRNAKALAGMQAFHARRRAEKEAAPAVKLPDHGCADAPVISLTGVPPIGNEHPWPYTFHPDKAAEFFHEAIEGKYPKTIVEENPDVVDLQDFLSHRYGVICTVRSMAPDAKRTKIKDLHASWLAGYTDHGHPRCTDA